MNISKMFINIWNPSCICIYRQSLGLVSIDSQRDQKSKFYDHVIKEMAFLEINDPFKQWL